MRIASILVLAICAAAVGADKVPAVTEKDGPRPAKWKFRVVTARDKTAVRAWMDEHAPGYEEIEWQGMWEDTAIKWKNKDKHLVRLIFREDGPRGRMNSDEIFYVTGGKAEPVLMKDREFFEILVFEPNGEKAIRSRAMAQFALDIKSGKAFGGKQSPLERARERERNNPHRKPNVIDP